MPQFNLPVWIRALFFGVTLGGSVLWFWSAWLVGPILFLVIKDLHNLRPKIRMLIWYSFILWASKTAVVLSFFWSVQQPTWEDKLEIGQQFGLLFFSFGLAVMAIGLGVLVLVFGLYSWRELSLRWSVLNIPLITSVAYAGIWLGAEVAGSVGFALATLGTGSAWQAYFSFGYIGYALASWPGFIYYATYGGVYGLSFLLVLLVTCSVLAFSRQNRIVLTGVVVGLMLVGWLRLEVRNSPTIGTVTMVHTDLHLTNPVDKFYEYKRTTLKEAVLVAQAQNPDYIILPEDSRYLTLVYPSNTIAQSYGLYRFTNQNPALIIDSGRINNSATGIGFLQSSVFSADLVPVHTYKQYLTPQGEYFPWLVVNFLKIINNQKIGLVNSLHGNYQIGPTVMIDQPNLPGVLFCFEAVRPTAVRALVKQYTDRPPFVAYLSSQAWFKNLSRLEYQLDTMLRVQAVWNDITIIGAGNASLGKVYTPAGKQFTPAIVATGPDWSVQLVTI